MIIVTRILNFRGKHNDREIAPLFEKLVHVYIGQNRKKIV